MTSSTSSLQRAERNRGHGWLAMALLAGVAYCAIGRLFAFPTTHAQAWRWAAWLVSGVVYALHIAYECFKLGNSPRRVALHVAAGVAVGGFGLALIGMVRSMIITATIRPVWLISLVAWPAITAIPGYLGALILSVVLTRMHRRAARP